MMEFTHNCIKCSVQYKDSDTDAYYCGSCNEARKVIAREVDAKLKSISRSKPTSSLQEYNAAPKVRGFMKVTLN